MELQQLKNQLEKEIRGTIVHTDIWCIPMHTYEITYQPIQKKAMDILMKILLFSFQKSAFESAEQLSEILLVEPLFIEDLMRKMQKNGLLARENNFYQLTEKGKRQFSQGVFEEELDPVTIELLYSPVHHQMMNGDMEEVLDFDDFPDQLYRYMNDGEESLDVEFFKKEIQNIIIDRADEVHQEIKSILSLENTQINDVPCIEFIVWNTENREFFPRVWNTLLKNWDQYLEKELFEIENPVWLEKFHSKIK
ncbi:nucleoside-diphosphate sugar epimerase [Ureibacillus sp. FSL K6-3587]|uniref:nucleoside-diphosphate sugar epimerase n=1 Tax=Ureibacillus sp. FSL K6-3587 TaxID=2954681 RepID=UPI001EB8A343|nr:nucleoside-diphosphate sugar epimerase [Bacilli bacterium]